MTMQETNAISARRPRQRGRRAYSPNATDMTRLRAISEANNAARRAQAAELEAVRAARAAGIPWHWIAEKLGVSRQTAQARFADKVDQPAVCSIGEPAPSSHYISVSSQQNERRDG
jgi:hypothetical protein